MNLDPSLEKIYIFVIHIFYARHDLYVIWFFFLHYYLCLVLTLSVSSNTTVALKKKNVPYSPTPARPELFVRWIRTPVYIRQPGTNIRRNIPRLEAPEREFARGSNSTRDCTSLGSIVSRACLCGSFIRARERDEHPVDDECDVQTGKKIKKKKMKRNEKKEIRGRVFGGVAQLMKAYSPMYVFWTEKPSKFWAPKRQYEKYQVQNGFPSIYFFAKPFCT